MRDLGLRCDSNRRNSPVVAWESRKHESIELVPIGFAAATEFVRHVTAASRDERDPMWTEEARAWARSSVSAKSAKLSAATAQATGFAV